MARRLSGYAQILSPDAPLWESDTVSCCHCGGVIFVKPGTASTVYLITDPITHQTSEVPGASCFHCWKPVCLTCYATGVCVPLEKWLTLLEAKHRQSTLLPSA